MTILGKKEFSEKAFKKCYMGFGSMVLTTVALTGAVLASGTSGDLSTMLNNLTQIVCNIVSAFGLLLAVWGCVSFGRSFASHDAQQRQTGILELVGGVIVCIAPQILREILAGTSVDTSALPSSGMIDFSTIINTVTNIIK